MGTAVTVTAVLDAISGHDVTVPFTVSGTAEGGGIDHDLVDGNIIITAGDLTGTTSFNVTDDNLDEDDETVILTMGTPVNATPGAVDQHTVTIVDDDSMPGVSFTSASQPTLDESVTDYFITAQLSAASGCDVTVPFTLSGTAVDPDDYTITASPITITAGNIYCRYNHNNCCGQPG